MWLLINGKEGQVWNKKERNNMKSGNEKEGIILALVLEPLVLSPAI